MIAMTVIWDESVAFINRERALLVPLGLATCVLGDAGTSLALPALQASGDQGNTFALVGAVISGLISMSGQLAVTAMVLRGCISIGEALRLGWSRLPKLILIGIVFVSVALLAMLPFILMLVTSGVDLTSAKPNLPGWAALFFIGFAVFSVWVAARLITLTPHIVDRNPPMLSAIRTSFSQTKGHTAKIIGVFALYMIVAIVIGFVARLVLAGPLIFLGNMIGAPAAGAVLGAVAASVVGGGLAMVAAIYIAHLYRRLAT
jgi:hypothetical protein